MQAAFLDCSKSGVGFKRLILLLLIVAAIIIPSVFAQAKKYARCADLNEVYPHGVGKPGARDKVSASKPTPVTNFTVNAAIYEANTHLDRDDDGIACERL